MISENLDSFTVVKTLQVDFSGRKTTGNLPFDPLSRMVILETLIQWHTYLFIWHLKDQFFWVCSAHSADNLMRETGSSNKVGNIGARGGSYVRGQCHEQRKFLVELTWAGLAARSMHWLTAWRRVSWQSEGTFQTKETTVIQQIFVLDTKNPVCQYNALVTFVSRATKAKNRL